MGRALPDGLAPVFDYGNITDDHKAAAEEIIGLLRQLGIDLPTRVIAERFKLVEPNRFDFTQTKFYDVCKEANVFLGVQGFVVNHDDPEKVEYPIISISEDIRKLENLFLLIKSKE